MVECFYGKVEGVGERIRVSWRVEVEGVKWYNYRCKGVVRWKTMRRTGVGLVLFYY